MALHVVAYTAEKQGRLASRPTSLNSLEASTAPTSRPLGSSRRQTRLTGMDGLGILAGFLYTLTITCVLSYGRVFWEDEMLGWMLLRDPSWHHMIEAWKLGADGGGFSFYLTGRMWLHLFGPSELAFRLYSSTCFGLAFGATWAAARRFYSTPVVGFALFNTWFCATPFILHMREGRFYGLLVLGAALAVWLAFTVVEREGPLSRPLYAALFLVHGLLTTSHILGVVFSASILAANVACDRLYKRWRPALYLTVAASWLLLLPERTAILASARVGRPHFWTTAPTLGRFFGVYSGSSGEIALVLGMLLVAAATTLLRAPEGFKQALCIGFSRRMPVYIVTASLLLVPIEFLVEGLLGIWLLNNRYLLPITLATVYVTAEALQLIQTNLPRDLTPGRSRAFLLLRLPAIVFVAATLIVWDFHHLREESESPRDYTGALTARLPTTLPVVCEDAFSFTELLGRRHASGVRYTYLLDWPQSINPSAPRLEVTQYHLMENWRKVGYFSGSIQPIEQFLQQNRTFLVIHAALDTPQPPRPEIGNPLAERFQHNPAYEVREYTRFKRPPMIDTVWLVCRGKCPASSLANDPPSRPD